MPGDGQTPPIPAYTNTNARRSIIMSEELKLRISHPVYGGDVLYQESIPGSGSGVAWQFKGWPSESMSWKETCYIHGGLSGINIISTKGPDAKKALESICINSFANFPVGSMKHCVMCNEEGIIETHGIIERIAEDHFTSFAGGPPGRAMNSFAKLPFDMKVERLDWYIFQIAGPTSLALIEKLTGENLHDLKFLHQRNSKVLGKYTKSGRDITVEVSRIGMARNLAYELHGPMEESAEVYDAAYNVGQEFGVERLGWRTYFVNHTEGGFPQSSGHFVTPINVEVVSFMSSFSGSVDPANVRARFRTPVEVAWGHLAKPDHDYVGRAAVEAELANPKRTTITLRWNAEDVLDVWGSLLKPGEALPILSMPVAPEGKSRGGHQDIILQNGREIGYSSGIVYSYYFHEYLSLGCIDLDASALGTEVKIRWGDFGGKYKDIRATVAVMPYLSQGKFGQPEPK
jgi:glycine cleavage system aminomethyltransferase T